tara:strand:+ start:631 stop:960 length:330 start_codon:yes stop_codon:yes gene_type:complete
MITKSVTIKANTTYKYLQLWNGIFNLTEKELKILSHFIDLRDSIEGSNLCGIDNKKEVAKILDIKDPNTLNNYVKRFKDKGVVRKVNNTYLLSKMLDPTTEQIIINIKK